MHFRLGPESRFKILSPRSEAQHCDGSVELNIFGKERAIFKVQSCCQTCGVNAEDGDGEKVTGAKWETRIPSTSFLAEFLHRVFSVCFALCSISWLAKDKKKEGRDDQSWTGVSSIWEFQAQSSGQSALIGLLSFVFPFH